MPRRSVGPWLPSPIDTGDEAAPPGRDKLTRFYVAVAETAADLQVRMPTLNGMPGVFVIAPSASGRQAPRFAMTLDLDRDGKISCLYVVSASRQLTALR